MDNNTIGTVLQEILEEQRSMTKANRLLMNKADEVTKKLEAIDKKIELAGLTNDCPDTESVKNMLLSGFDNIRQIMESQPKNVIHQKRYLLFPEFTAREHLAVVLRWLLYILIATYCYWIFKYLIER